MLLKHTTEKLQSNLHFLYFCFSVYCNMFTAKKLNLKNVLFNQQKLRNFHLQEILFQLWKHPPHLSDFRLWRDEVLTLSKVKATSDTSFSKGITTDRTYWSCILPHKNIPLHVLRAKPNLSSFLHTQIHFFNEKFLYINTIGEITNLLVLGGKKKGTLKNYM